MNEGRYDDAARKYRDAIQRYQFDPDFYENLGVASQKLGDYISAEQAFKRAVALNDKDWTAWMDLGNAYLKQNRLKEALSTFEHTLKLNPPPADRKFLQDDISDIHKVLRKTSGRSRCLELVLLRLNRLGKFHISRQRSLLPASP